MNRIIIWYKIKFLKRNEMRLRDRMIDIGDKWISEGKPYSDNIYNTIKSLDFRIEAMKRLRQRLENQVTA